MSLRRYTVAIDDRSFTVDVLETAADRFEVSVDGRAFEATLLDEHDLPGAPISPQVATSESRVLASTAGAGSGADPAVRGSAPVVPVSPPAAALHRPAPRPRAMAGRADGLSSPMPGVVLEVFVAPGTSVRRGDALLVMEAMKMRNTIRSPRDAVVVEVAVAAGQPVRPGELLVSLGDAPG